MAVVMSCDDVTQKVSLLTTKDVQKRAFYLRVLELRRQNRPPLDTIDGKATGDLRAICVSAPTRLIDSIR
jgi:hypothetical protein